MKGFAAGQFYGFHGSKTSQFPPDKNGVWKKFKIWKCQKLLLLSSWKDPDFFSFVFIFPFFFKILVHNNSHLASTYCAIAILKIVGYELSNLDSEPIVSSMRNLQQPDGRYGFETWIASMAFKPMQF